MTTFKYTVAILGFLAAFAIGGYYYIVSEFTDSGKLATAAEEVSERKVQSATGTFENKTDLAMTELEIQIYIHHMTHQHVIADEKWGNVATTPQNIENLLTIVQANQDAYEHSDFYIGVLKKWEQGDFSNAVEVHNTIWEWHNGTVGVATGLLNGD